ncbi:hypothetical protein LINPERPRIM_LOCUS7105 [Linum perenne]
MRQSRQQIAG